VENNTIYILAIESSCDDTSAAVLCNKKVLSNVVATQKIHEEYGGVVPELASRAHQQNIVPVVHQALTKANIDKKQLSAIAFTRGPGLMGSLLVGTSFATTFAFSLDIPLIAVNHMQAHILAHFISKNEKLEMKNEKYQTNIGLAKNSKSKIQNPKFKKPFFPFICLTVSGGHTQIVKVNSYFNFEILGETLDDAAGEAFDKSAKILGLPYPGGPLIDKYAQNGDAHKYQFPKPKTKNKLDFSFSGFKTAVLRFIQKNVDENSNFIKENLNDICASIQNGIVSILMDKLKTTVKETGIKQIAIAGGVSANTEIRKQLKEAEKQFGWQTFIPPIEYTTDNAAMIGIAGYLKFIHNNFEASNNFATARLKVDE
jgi:N6-L-threonylcarbamoyladenine synthase